jgi:hypothetical protein
MDPQVTMRARRSPAASGTLTQMMDRTTFAWISRNRRLAGFRTHATTVAAFIRLAMISHAAPVDQIVPLSMNPNFLDRPETHR